MSSVKKLLYAMADDALVLGHRNSEWTGIGPYLEEDLAFSSMAQDKIGHAQALYEILHSEYGEKNPDFIGFLRSESEMCCCHFTELPIGGYDFSLVRHYLYDVFELMRYEDLNNSSVKSLSQLSRKIKGELKYHVMHAETWMRQLAQGNEESKARLQSSLKQNWNIALGMFEELEGESDLIKEGVFCGHKALYEKWFGKVSAQLSSWGLTVPSDGLDKMETGGRKGYHSEHLKPLLDEMSEVIRLDASAEW